MKKKLPAIILVLLLIFTFTACDKEKKEAKENFKQAVTHLEEQNASLDKTLEKAEKTANTKKTPLEESTISDLRKEIKTAKKSKVDVPEMPKETEEINKEAKRLKSIDYTKEQKALEEKILGVENSIKQLEQLTNPKEEFVVERLSTIPSLTGVEAVTEENDPNGQLNKPGGYTAAVFFSHSDVNPADVVGTTVIDKGTDGGGCIEVYKTKEDAQKRNDYLAGFDGSILSSGSHRVVGTILIRTSDKLTASQQKQLEDEVYNALTKL